MQTEQIKMSDGQIQQISSILQKQGLTPAEINKILNGEYTTFQTDTDLVNIFNFDGNYQNVLRELADGYSINQYSNGSNMILSMKRGTADKSEIQNGIRTDMMSKLQTRGLTQEQVSSLENYISGLDFSKPLHENYELMRQYMQEMNIQKVKFKKH